jgi:GTP cyclohydrolase I
MMNLFELAKKEDPRINDEEFKQLLVRTMIEAIGDDPNREGVLDTPRRVVKSWGELYSGYKVDPKDILSTTFEKNGFDQLVLCKNIEFYSGCEHHMLPIIGVAHVGYLPGERVVGLSKLARLVDMYARRLQIQENMTTQIAKALLEHLKPQGVGVIIKAKHFCMCSRGVGKQESAMTTSAMYGVLRDNPSARAEFLKLCEM